MSETTRPQKFNEQGAEVALEWKGLFVAVTSGDDDGDGLRGLCDVTDLRRSDRSERLPAT